jgi:MFS family permease
MSEPRSFAALREPRFSGFFLGVASVMMADAIEHVISYWVLFEKFRSPALGGFAIVSHWLPFLLLSIYTGGLADRYDPRRIIQIGVGLFMLVSLAWGLLFLTGSLEMWHAALLLVLHGCAGVTWGPSAQVLIHHMVDERRLPSAVRLTATARWLGLMLGPALGGPVLLMLGPTYGIFVNALIYLPFLLWVRTIPYTRKAAPPRLRGFGDVMAAIRVVRGNRLLLSMTLLAGAASLLVGNAYHAQMPEFARDFGHADADFTYSMLFAADALGALTAGLVLESRGLLRPRAKTAYVLAILWCIAIGGFALARSYPLALALLFVAGFLELAFFAMAQTLLQLHAPAEMRGRVIGVFIMSAMGLRAFSGVTIGVGGSFLGIHTSLAASAGLLLGLLALGLLLARRLGTSANP